MISNILRDFFYSRIFLKLLFTFQIFEDFSDLFLLLIFNSIPLWLVNILSMVIFILNLWKFVFWPKILSILKSVPHVFEKNVHSAGQDVLQMSARSGWWWCHSDCIFADFFCLAFSVIESGISESSTITGVIICLVLSAIGIIICFSFQFW